MPRPVLRELLRGRGAHVDPVRCLAGLPAEAAGRALPGAEHTIWQLAWHMNFWMDYELRSLDGREARYPAHAAESWPLEASPPSESAWQEAVGRFALLVERLVDWSRRAEEPAVGDRIVHPAKGESVEDVLWQMAAHNSYHTGQVALLRRAFGLWPPEGGGDTW